MKETIGQFLARGGIIEKVRYATLEELEGEEIPVYGMRTSINSGFRNSEKARQMGIASGKVRRENA